MSVIISVSCANLRGLEVVVARRVRVAKSHGVSNLKRQQCRHAKSASPSGQNRDGHGRRNGRYARMSGRTVRISSVNPVASSHCPGVVGSIVRRV
jgi:hypothetical protein